MSQLAQNWIENNFQLNKKIITLEKSFSNGYLFLKILEQKNLLEEEDINNINDNDIPTNILKNMNILTRRLKLINITLTKQQIADIISEQPGSAADLIMSLKKKFEGISTSPRWRNTAYKNAIHSLNPKTIRKLEGETKQDTQFFSTLVGKGSHFREIDSYAQQKQYYDFDVDEEQRYKDRLEKDQLNKLNSVAERRRKFLENLDNRIEKRNEITNIGTKNWKTNELTKKKRLTRHLQYELSIIAQSELKQINENIKFRNDQENSIEEFENNLKRNGLGGDDTSNGEVMLPTTEDSLMYLNRIEDKVQNNWPSNGEIGDFMQNLEKRTRELRLARQEKARRKRRLQVEQKAALLEIGGSSAPVSRSTSFDASSLTNETPQQKLDRKQREYEEITEKSKLERQLQAEEGEKRVKIFAERQRMIAYENNTWLNKKEEVLASQALRLKEKKLRNYTTCKAIVNDLISDLFSIDSNHPSINNNNNNSNNNNKGNENNEDDIYHTNLSKELQLIYQNGLNNGNNNHNNNNNNSEIINLPVYNQVSRSVILDLYPSAILLASHISKWKQIKDNDNDNNDNTNLSQIQQFSRISSFRESALEIFQQFREYSESKDICPFLYDNSSEYIHLLNLLTSQQKENGITLQQSIFLIAGENHDLPINILSIICNWLGGQDMISILTISQAIQLGFNLRNYGMNGELFDSSTIKFEHLVEIFNIKVQLDKTQYPEISYQASRIINDINDIISRILSGNTLLSSTSPSSTPSSSITINLNSIELNSFKFSDCTLAIILAQILWLREYVCSIINNITGIPPLTPIVLTSLNFGTYNRSIILKIFDWFLRGGSRTNLPEGDEAIQNEINDEIATVPIEKGKKANKPATKGKKDKKDTSEEIKSQSSIKTLFWIEGILNDNEINDITLELNKDHIILDVVELYSKKLKKKYQNIQNNNDNLNGIEIFSKDINSYFIKLQNTIDNNNNNNNTFQLYHAFNFIEVVISTILYSIKSILTNNISNDYVSEIYNSVNDKRQLLTSSQRIWLNHIMKINPIDFNLISNVLDKLKISSGIELDSLSGFIISLLLKIQNVRTEMFHEKALLSNTFKLTEGQWRDTCLEWREFFIETEKSNRKLINTTTTTNNNTNNNNHNSIQTLFNSKSRELECELGDLIDYRHQRWTKNIDELNKKLLKYLNEFYITINELTKSVSNNILGILKQNIDISIQLAILLDKAGYKQFPWILKTDVSKAGTSRTDYNRLRDEIRNQYLLLNSLINSNNQQNYDISIEISQFFSKLDNIIFNNNENESTSNTLQSSVIYELKTEGLEMTISMLRTLSECLKSINNVHLSIIDDLKDYSFKRNQYEHKILREWIEELRKSFNSPSNELSSLSSAINFMNSYYFGVSDDPEHDGVPRSSLGNKGLVDVGEMVLSIRKIKLLSLELLIGRSQNLLNDNSFDPYKFLTSAIQRLYDRSESLPITWRNVKKIQNFVESICLHHDLASTSIEQFNIELILRLLLGSIPRSIPSTYISKLGKKILEETSSSLNIDSPCVVKLSTILGIISKDKILSLGWWPYIPNNHNHNHNNNNSSSLNTSNISDYQNHLDLVQLIIEIIALTCALPDTLSIDSKNPTLINHVDIHVDKFLSVMCYGPSIFNESISILQSSLCLTYDSSSDEEILNSFINLKQQYFYESITKLLFIGNNLISNNENNENDENNGNVENDNIIQLNLNKINKIVFGPNISPKVLKWIQIMNQSNNNNNNDNENIDEIKNNENNKNNNQSENILCFDYLQSLSLTGVSM